MSAPLFIHVVSTGDIWVSASVAFTAPGTVLATYKVNPLAKSQIIGTISGSSGSYAASGSTGKTPAKEIV